MAAVAVNKPIITAIVLAAGESRRMGAQNKLHLPINGVPLIRRTLETLLASELGEIIVVVGHEYQATQSLLDGLAVQMVYNEDYQSGQMSSVHCGLAALTADSSGVMIALGDQPAITVDDINFLINAFHRRNNREVIIPTYQGDRGNPIIISPKSRIEILSGKRNFGCRKFIEKNPDQVKFVAMSSPGVTIDLDTAVEYNFYCNTNQPPNAVSQVN